MLILGIETSCDETASSVVKDSQTILSNVIATSLAEHSPFGGVIPEIACRHHVEWIHRTVNEALIKADISGEELDGIAVTQGPGLPGALLVGISMAKAMAMALEKPILGVHHLQAHLYANFLEFPGRQSIPSPYLNFPYMGLIVSGGHTLLVLVKNVDDYKIIGQTADDAVGEAFDKVAKLLGLGYPGGPIIDANAKKGNPRAICFPRAMIHEKNFNFSFSGVKTAVLYYLQDTGYRVQGTKKQNTATSQLLNPDPCTLTPRVLNDLCASFQEAVVDVLVEKSLRACEEYGVETLIVGGGVAANSRLRERLKEEKMRKGLHQVLFPPKGLSIDNAAMIAGLGGALFKKGYQSDLSFTAQSNWNIETALDEEQLIPLENTL